jgi:hypothetical protein
MMWPKTVKGEQMRIPGHAHFVTLGMAALVGLLGAPLAASAAQAGTIDCLIINHAIGARYHSLQAAQNAATAGATLWVRGTCTGTTQVSKDLTITGQRAVGFGAPTLDGKLRGSVLTIGSGITVTVNKLTITGGTSIFGGGIDNSGTLTVNDSKITGNVGHNTGDGGGIYNSDFGTLTLHSSGVTRNTLSGGIFNGGTLTLDSSSVTGNTTNTYGGGIYNDFGTVALNDGSSITDNTARGHFGGGVFNYGGTLTLDSSSITGDTAGSDGGGVFNTGLVALKDGSTMTGDTAGSNGGGIYNDTGSVTLDNSSITGNTAGSDGGGIYNLATLTLDSSSVTGNLPDDIS